MHKKRGLSGLVPLLWGAVILALIALVSAALENHRPTAYTDAVYVSTEVGK